MEVLLLIPRSCIGVTIIMMFSEVEIVFWYVLHLRLHPMAHLRLPFALNDDARVLLNGIRPGSRYMLPLMCAFCLRCIELPLVGALRRLGLVLFTVVRCALCCFAWLCIACTRVWSRHPCSNVYACH